MSLKKKTIKNYGFNEKKIYGNRKGIRKSQDCTNLLDVPSVLLSTRRVVVIVAIVVTVFFVPKLYLKNNWNTEKTEIITNGVEMKAFFPLNFRLNYKTGGSSLTQ